MLIAGNTLFSRITGLNVCIPLLAVHETEIKKCYHYDYKKRLLKGNSIGTSSIYTAITTEQRPHRTRKILKLIKISLIYLRLKLYLGTVLKKW